MEDRCRKCEFCVAGFCTVLNEFLEDFELEEMDRLGCPDFVVKSSLTEGGL